MNRIPYSEILAYMSDDMGWTRDDQGKPLLDSTEFHAARRAISRALVELWDKAFWKDLLDVTPHTFEVDSTDVPMRVDGTLVIGRVEGVYQADPRLYRGAGRLHSVVEGEVIRVRNTGLETVWVRHLPPVPKLVGDVWSAMQSYLPEGSEGTYDLRWGTSLATSLDIAGIESLEGFAEVGTLSGTRTFDVSGYKYVAFQTELGSPAAVTGFIDASTGLVVSMAGPDEGFSNVENGWGYQLLTLSGGIWRVYRTRHQLGAAMNLILS